MEQDHCTTFRRCVTGANEYRYYRNGNQIGTAAALVTPRYPVVITGNKRTVHCEHDPDRPLFPGCSNSIFSGSEEYAKIIYLGQGQHSLQIGSLIIRILSRQDKLYFLQDNALLAVLRTISGRTSWAADWEPRQIMRVMEDIPENQLLLMLSFPLLQIGM